MQPTLLALRPISRALYSEVMAASISPSSDSDISPGPMTSRSNSALRSGSVSWRNRLRDPAAASDGVFSACSAISRRGCATFFRVLG